MKSERFAISTRRLRLTLAAVTLALFSSGMASAFPYCWYGELIRDPTGSSTVGCRYSLSTWNSTSLTPAYSTLMPTGGDCVLDLDTAYHSTVLSGGALPVSTTGIVEPRILDHCLDSPVFEEYFHGACVDEFWNWVVNYWPMDKGTGTDVADKVGGDDGTIFGATRAAGWRESGLYFDGVNDYVEVPDSANLDAAINTNDFSIDFWIKTNQGAGTYPILDKRVSSPAYRGWHVYLVNGTIGLQLADGGHTNYTNTTTVNDNGWHHVAITVDRNHSQGIRFYVDGQFVGWQNPTGRQGDLSNSSPLRIARRTAGSGYWRGTIDELAIHAGVLDPATVADLADPDKRGKCYYW